MTESGSWTREDLNLVVPAHITFNRNHLGELELIAISATIDYRVGTRDGIPFAEFTWQGSDEGQPVVCFRQTCMT
jgi:hypothetical protein